MIYLISFLMKILSSIPFGILYILSDGIFYLLYYVVRYRRRIVRKNLVESFPEKSEQEILEIEKKFYHFFTDNILESLKMTTISPKEISRRMKFKNLEAINNTMKDGKFIALYMGHYGNWEWVSSLPLHMENDSIGVQIYHELRNKNMNKLVLRNRGRMGAINVEMRQTVRYIKEMVSSNKIGAVGFIADQSPKKREVRHFLPFLHHNIPVLTGTEKIIKHFGFEAWFLDVKRVKRGYYEAEFVKMHDNPQSLPDFELTAIYYKMLEEMIKNRPELYLWSHNRFKHAIELKEE